MLGGAGETSAAAAAAAQSKPTECKQGEEGAYIDGLYRLQGHTEHTDSLEAQKRNPFAETFLRREISSPSAEHICVLDLPATADTAAYLQLNVGSGGGAFGNHVTLVLAVTRLPSTQRIAVSLCAKRTRRKLSRVGDGNESEDDDNDDDPEGSAFCLTALEAIEFGSEIGSGGYSKRRVQPPRSGVWRDQQSDFFLFSINIAILLAAVVLLIFILRGLVVRNGGCSVAVPSLIRERRSRGRHPAVLLDRPSWRGQPQSADVDTAVASSVSSNLDLLSAAS